jgi:LEA14-like dessication related protein
MSGKNKGWIIVSLVVLAILGGVVYLLTTNKFYPKVKSVKYLQLELGQDTAQVNTGVQVQNRIPLPITLDSIHYSIIDRKDTLGWGQMTSNHTLPALGDKVIDFMMLLDFDKYRAHLQKQKGEDSIALGVKMEVFFDLPILSPKSITINREFKVPVSKSPSLKVEDLLVKDFDVRSGYTLLLKIDAKNDNLPGLEINNLAYDITISDSLHISGDIDSTFKLHQGKRLIEVPIKLETTDAIALVKKLISEENTWNYNAQLTAQVESDNQLFRSFKLMIEKDGVLDISSMGSGKDYLPKLAQVKHLDINSDEEQTTLQADLVIHNPAPIPFYIDSTSYFIRYKGKVIAKGTNNLEKILPKSGDQKLSLKLLIDESAYQEFMKRTQGKQKVAIELELNLIYNLPNEKRQKIKLVKVLQVPVPGQASINVAGLEVKELDPDKGAFLNLILEIKSSNLPNLKVKNLDYRLQLKDEITILGKTKEPIKINDQDSLIEIPLQLSAADVNQLIRRALKGSTDWEYDLKATAKILSDNKILGPTTIDLAFTGVLELKEGSGGNQLLPKITNIDTLEANIAFDTAWVNLKIHVVNPLPVPFYISNLAIKVTHKNDTIAISNNQIDKILPAEGEQSAWVQLRVNYSLWRDHLQHHQNQDSMVLKQHITLVYNVKNLEKDKISFVKQVKIPTPKVPVTELKQVTLRGFSLTKGILLNALVQVQNANTEGLKLSNVIYNICAQNLLDANGKVNSTYDIPLGTSTVKLPLSLGIGEVFRVLVSKLSGKNKSRELYINATATLDTSSPMIQNTFVRFEKWEKTALFQKQQQQNVTQ